MNRFRIALGKLMENHLSDILFNESANRDCIHLYRVGDCWVAFERSAFNLCRIYSKAVVNALKVFIAPFPIVLASVDDIEMPSAVGDMECTKRTLAERIYKVREPSDSKLFQKWHYQNTVAFHGF